MYFVKTMFTKYFLCFTHHIKVNKANKGIAVMKQVQTKLGFSLIIIS